MADKSKPKSAGALAELEGPALANNPAYWLGVRTVWAQMLGDPRMGPQAKREVASCGEKLAKLAPGHPFAADPENG